LLFIVPESYTPGFVSFEVLIDGVSVTRHQKNEFEYREKKKTEQTKNSYMIMA
jgi:hypothetical protein